MTTNNARPLSPHLTIWKWGWHMAVSILHRITGGALTVVGLGIMSWWLAALGSGQDQYDRFLSISGTALGKIVLAGLTWAFFQHLFSGLRHLVLDMGAGYDLKINRFWSIMTIVFSVLATAILWAWFTGYIPEYLIGVRR